MMIRVTYLGIYKKLISLFYIIEKGKRNNLLLCIVLIIVVLVYQVNNFLFFTLLKKIRKQKLLEILLFYRFGNKLMLNMKKGKFSYWHLMMFLYLKNQK